jgi:hypothetical protein
MLSFQITKSGAAIQIECDAEGMSVLLRTLAELIGEHASHRHLMGGTDLSATTPWGEKAVGEVIIGYAESGSN